MDHGIDAASGKLDPFILSQDDIPVAARSWKCTQRTLLADVPDHDNIHLRMCQARFVEMPWLKTRFCFTPCLFGSRHKETSLGKEIGAEVAPLCSASGPDGCSGRPVVNSSDQLGSQDAGWAPKDMTSTYVQHVRGILTLAQTLNGDVVAMIGRYRDKLAKAGADVASFDAAVVLCFSDL